MEVKNACDCCNSVMSPSEKHYLFGGYRICTVCANKYRFSEMYKKFKIAQVSDEIPAVDVEWR